jgi:hypothetical protein
MTEKNGPNRKRPLFRLGQIVATPGALSALEEAGQTCQVQRNSGKE